MARKPQETRSRHKAKPADGGLTSDGAIRQGKPAAKPGSPRPRAQESQHHQGSSAEARSERKPSDSDRRRAEPAPAAPPAPPEFTVVGVGASAGGLEAFSQLLRALPPSADLAVVYVQHLAPRYESSLPALLREATSMPVNQITDRMPVKPGSVYVIPPNAFLTIQQGKFRLSPRPEGRAQHAPVDHFFRSLAAYAQQRAVGVVLSGTDSDGAAGLREIKAVGGIAYAQEPSSAKFDGMPRAAVSTGAVDQALTPDAIALELARIARHPLVRHVKAKIAEMELAITQDQWALIFELLRGASGVDFTHYKQPTLRRRLQRRMVLHRAASIEAYLRQLQKDPNEVIALYQDILIHVTRFFREPESYEYLSSRVFPQIVRSRRGGDQPVRVWVPGCSTGEEAYSIAISLLEFLRDDANATPVQVFATDVSELAVEQARSGIYPESIVADVSAERLRRFFNKVDGSYRISKPVRDTVIFARQDLTRDPPFSKLDLIVCRNVLIYLGPLLQKKLMNVFHYALKPAGFLMLGASETIGPYADLFSLNDKRHKVYSKKMTGVRANMDFPAGDYAPQRTEDSRKAVGDARGGSSILNEANRIILNKYAPPGVIVDHELQIVQFRGQTGPFLEPAPGEASLNLLKMAREGLLYELRSALNEARKTGASARRDGLRVKQDGHIIDANIEITPMVVANDQRHFLVVFEEVSPEKGGAGPEMPSGGAKGSRKGKTVKGGRRLASAPDLKKNQHLVRLQQELAASREYLQSIIQDLEAANEELQSANEEILSSNEELQSTNEELDTAKEELQSTNEELNTVNEELQGRNEELSRANSDLLNLLSSVQIAVVMVTADLRIRRFTPMAEKVLNLIPTDIGRPIGDIKPNIDLPDLEKLILESVDTVSPIEREASDRQGTNYLVRIRPYKNVENRIDGAVLALFDMAMARPQDRASADARPALDALLDVAGEPMLLLDDRLRVVNSNAAFDKMLNVPAESKVGRSIFDLADGALDGAGLRDLLERILPNDGHVASFPLSHTIDGEGSVPLRVSAHRLRREQGGRKSDLILLSLRRAADGSVGDGAGSAETKR